MIPHGVGRPECEVRTARLSAGQTLFDATEDRHMSSDPVAPYVDPIYPNNSQTFSTPGGE